jgi:hypothetical protein
MRLFVVHDETGNIAQVVTCPSDGPTLGVAPPDGWLFSECEPPEYLADDADVDTLLDFMTTHRLQPAAAKATLVRLGDGDSPSG